MGPEGIDSAEGGEGPNLAKGIIGMPKMEEGDGWGGEGKIDRRERREQSACSIE